MHLCTFFASTISAGSFQRRLNKAAPWAEKYVQQFSSPLLSVYARFAAFLFSSLLAVLIFLWVINEQVTAPHL